LKFVSVPTGWLKLYCRSTATTCNRKPYGVITLFGASGVSLQFVRADEEPYGVATTNSISRRL
jgi:hypothetical protein